ncbi:MAG: MerR family transcriptional regulator [Muribaculaceae bacterium]|nr:MerR family transcriptional regulator [bacterium]MCM1494121.1 MerR family transcriptional regulator [Muribaculaceae bacterium]
MKTVSQVAKLTGISVRTLQYYDEIGLLKPSKFTPSGYRLYDDEALQTLQQILFLKELGFPLKEVKEILEKPDFDRITAFKKQKEMLLLKRDRIDGLIQLLSRLEKGEQCMSFKEFDLSVYIAALENFRSNSTDDVIKYWGNTENFDMFIQKVRDDESELAKIAVAQFGSVESFTESMKYNMAHFSEIMEKQMSQIPEELKQKDLFQELASKKDKDVSADEVQNIVREIIHFAYRNAPSEILGDQENYCKIIMETYSNDYLKTLFDTKNGAGSADYVVRAFQYARG